MSFHIKKKKEIKTAETGKIIPQCLAQWRVRKKKTELNIVVVVVIAPGVGAGWQLLCDILMIVSQKNTKMYNSALQRQQPTYNLDDIATIEIAKTKKKNEQRKKKEKRFSSNLFSIP